MKQSTAPKPPVFIGSSKESKGIAYAVQQNLRDEAEATVWDQGVFELSATTIEALTNVLEESDFGIFVFSADDVVKLRGNESAAVRDNVVFEMGLFIGRLGRSRVFYLVPSNAQLRIPSDLLGVTPATYDTARADENMQAALGPACHQIGLQIKKLGPLTSRKMAPSDPEPEPEKKPTKYDWLFDYFEGRFEAAKATLTESLKNLGGDDLLEAKTWIICCEIRTENASVFDKLFEFAKEHPDSTVVHDNVAIFLGGQRYNDLAIKFLSEASATVRENTKIQIRQSALHVANDDSDLALSLLKAASPSTKPAIALKMAEILESQEKLNDALDVIHGCYLENPGNKEIRFKYARLAQDTGLTPVALYLLDGLTGDEYNSAEYWGYLGNSCRALALDDRALAAYRHALSVLKPNESGSWLMGNIGNVFYNRELFSDAIENLEKAIQDNPKSQYAHDRLADALTNKETATKAYAKKCSEGLRMIRTRNAEQKKALEVKETPNNFPAPFAGFLEQLAKVPPLISEK